MAQDFDSRPLSLELWPDFEVVMGPQGACYGCWCTYFRMPPKERQKAAIRARVGKGPPPGLVCYRHDEPVGWVQVGPRSDVPRWNTPRTVSRPLDDADALDPAVWALSCFFIVSRHRGQGLSHLMLEAAIDYARQQGARCLESCPIDRTRQAASVGMFVGPSSIFHARGFAEVAKRKEGRPLMRLELV